MSDDDKQQEVRPPTARPAVPKPMPVPAAVKSAAPTNITVREAIAKLAMAEDMDAELCLSIHNSDPIPVTDITDTGDGQVTVS